MSRLLLLPPAGEDVQVRLKVEAQANVVHWHRTFGSTKVNTRHSFQTESFSEHMGPFALRFRIEASPDGILIRQFGITAFGIPIPRWIGPRVTGKITPGPDDESWHVDVLIRHDRFGDICRYHGMMRAE